MNKVKLKAWLGFLFLALAMGLLLFVPARTIDYWQAWLFLAVYFTGSLFVSLYLMKQDPALLQRRMRGGPTAEKQREQKLIMLVASLGFIALLVVPALDHRTQCRERVLLYAGAMCTEYLPPPISPPHHRRVLEIARTPSSS